MPIRISGPNLELPWSSSFEENRRLKKVLLILFVPLTVIAAVIPFIDVPEPDRQTLEKVPPRLAKVLLKEKEKPKPTPLPTKPPEPTPEPEEELVKKEPEKKPEEKAPEPEPEPVEPVVKSEPTVVQIEAARERAEEAISDVVDDLAALQNEFDFSDLGSEELSDDTPEEVVAVSRNVIGDATRAGSGDIQTSSNAPTAKSTGLGKQQTAKVTNAKRTQAAQQRKKQRDAAKVAASGQSAKRSQDEIRRVMDNAKSAVFRLYDRALRKNPVLEGNFKFELVIEPNGRVSSVKMLSSELDDPALEKKLIARIRSIKFEAKSVSRTTVQYDYTFLPS